MGVEGSVESERADPQRDTHPYIESEPCGMRDPNFTSEPKE